MTFDPYTGDGSTTQYDITFPYRLTSTVHASVDGVETTAFTFINPSRIEFDVAPPNGSEIKIFRKTPLVPSEVTFEDGAILTEADLNAAVAQARDATEENISDIEALNDASLRAPIGETLTTLPPAVERAGYYSGWDEAGQPALMLGSDGTGGALALALAATGGADLTGFADDVAYGPGTIGRSLKGHGVNVQDAPYNATGDGSTDDSAAILAAIAEALTMPYEERVVIFPAGKYSVPKLNLRDMSFLTFYGAGTVQILGNDGTQGYILGDDRYDELGHVESFTTAVRFLGGPWLVGPQPGQTYERAVKLQNFTNSVFENLQPSGDYSPAGGVGDKITVEIELSFNNLFVSAIVGYPGAPIGADASFGLWLGYDNVNNNRFLNYRGVGGGSGIANTYGVRINGLGNMFIGGDISSIHTAFQLHAAKGAHITGTYHETVSGVAKVNFASSGVTFSPAYADIMANGTAYDLSGHQTVAIAIIGGWHKFNATGTTFIDKGINCYAPVLLPGIDYTNPPAIYSTGTDRGSGGTGMLDASEIALSRVSFPDVARLSANVTTLDDYREGTWTPHSETSGITFASANGSYTKIGDTVTLHFAVTWPAAGNANNARIEGLPFAETDTVIRKGATLGFQQNPNGYVVNLVAGELAVIDPATGLPVTNTQCVDLVLHGSVTYKSHE